LGAGRWSFSMGAENRLAAAPWLGIQSMNASNSMAAFKVLDGMRIHHWIARLGNAESPG